MNALQVAAQVYDPEETVPGSKELGACDLAIVHLNSQQLVKRGTRSCSSYIRARRRIVWHVYCM